MSDIAGVVLQDGMVVAAITTDGQVVTPLDGVEWTGRSERLVETRTALVPLGQYRKHAPEVTNERNAVVFAINYLRGWEAALDAVFRGRLRSHSGAVFFPTYTELRDHLGADCNVAPLLAARVALYLTRHEIDRPQWLPGRWVR